MVVGNIVIVGASFAGHSLANNLAKLPSTHRIVLIDRNAFAVHLPGVVRAVVVPGSEERLTARLSQDTIFPARSRHAFVNASVVEIKQHSVLLDREFEGSTELPFDKLVLATGATGAVPIRPATSTLEAYKEALRQSQAGIAKAESVLIVGGGAVGVEVAGEITSHYPEKKVTLVHSRDKLLVTAAGDSSASGHIDPKKSDHFHYAKVPERVSDALEEQLRDRGVDVILRDRIVFPSDPPDADSGKESTDESSWDGSQGTLGGLRSIALKSGKRVTADFVFLSTGGRPNTSLLPESVDRTTDGYVLVDDHFRVHALADVYALGDVASMPSRKTAGVANYEGSQLARILLDAVAAQAKGTQQRKRPYAVPPFNSTVIPLGDHPVGNIGAGAMEMGWMGMWNAPKWMIRWMAKDYFIDTHFFYRFHGKEKVNA